MRHIFLLSVLTILMACSDKNNQLDRALKLAGKNRMELQKALDHYKTSPADSLKYKATVFLIENMPYYYYYQGKQLDHYLTFFETLAGNRYTETSDILDSFQKKYGHFSLDNLEVKYDIREINAEFLINNIEQAFQVWQEQPWGVNVSFENFCEFILPYRLGNEQLTEWRDSLYNKYNPLLDDFRNNNHADDPLYAAMALMDTLIKQERYYTTAYPIQMPNIGPYACQWLVGSCREFTDYPIYLCRALGIPCGEDLMSQRGDDNSGHSWNFYIDKNGNNYMQEFPRKILPTKNSHRIVYANPLKVYRKTFSINENFKKDFDIQKVSPYPLFRIPVFCDVTDKYLNKTYSMKVSKTDMYSGIKPDRLLYLCMAAYKDWYPVTWGKFNDDTVVFENIGIGSVYRIAMYKDNNLEFISEPFSINENGTSEFYGGSGKTEDMILFSKFNLKFEEEIYQKTVNGIFEGSNDPLFTNRDTLFVIRKIPERLFTYTNINQPKTYKYMRYCGADSTYCHIAEIAFYENNTDLKPLDGKIIGTEGSRTPNGKHKYTNAIDGNNSTSFEYKEPSGGWVGLSFDQPKKISKIRYTPPNRENFIRPGNTYELFYFDKKWIMFDNKKTTADSVVFLHVPQNTLFYLDCPSDGIQRRVFKYQNGKQIYL